jgi:hypothetical protein
MTLISVYAHVPKYRRASNAPALGRTSMKANPTRHYRSSLGFGSDTPTTSRHISVSALNRPGGASSTNSTTGCIGDAIPVKDQIISDPSCGIPVTRPASTILSPTYYSDTQSYLKARAKGFDQHDIGHRLFATPPSGEICEANTTMTPTNKKYHVSGAVSSGTRIERIKYEAMRRPGVRNDSPHYVKIKNTTVCCPIK